jgi:hypothetical protein
MIRQLVSKEMGIFPMNEPWDNNPESLFGWKKLEDEAEEDRLTEKLGSLFLFRGVQAREREHPLYSTYAEAQRKAAIRRWGWDLTFEQYLDVVVQPCRTCGRFSTGTTRTVVDRWEKRTGVDRWENRLGYTQCNAVPSCADCNMSKGMKSVEQWLRLVATFSAHYVEFWLRALTIAGPITQADIEAISSLSMEREENGWTGVPLNIAEAMFNRLQPSTELSSTEDRMMHSQWERATLEQARDLILPPTDQAHIDELAA